MASWQDGPEYASLLRPDAFIVPDVQPLTASKPRIEATPAVPTQLPQFLPADGNLPALEFITPETTRRRDPLEPFAVVAATITQGAAISLSAGRLAPDRVPEQSFRISTTDFPPPKPGITPMLARTGLAHPVNPPPFPQSVDAARFAPPPGQTPRNRPTMLSVLGVGVILPLLIGVLISDISPVALVVSALFALRVPYAVERIRLVYVLTAVVAAIWIMTNLSMYAVVQFSDIWDSIASYSQIACLVTGVALMKIVDGAIVRGEPPSRKSRG